MKFYWKVWKPKNSNCHIFLVRRDIVMLLKSVDTPAIGTFI